MNASLIIVQGIATGQIINHFIKVTGYVYVGLCVPKDLCNR